MIGKEITLLVSRLVFHNLNLSPLKCCSVSSLNQVKAINTCLFTCWSRFICCQLTSLCMLTCCTHHVVHALKWDHNTRHLELHTQATLNGRIVENIEELLDYWKNYSSEKKSQIKLNPRNYLSKLLIEAKLRIFTAKKVKFTRCCPSKENKKTQ